jgi:hypothetical protein
MFREELVEIPIAFGLAAEPDVRVLHFDALNRRDAAHERGDLDVADDQELIDDEEFVVRAALAPRGEFDVVDDDAASFNESGAANADFQVWIALAEEGFDMAPDLVVHADVHVETDRHDADQHEADGELEEGPAGVD